MPIVSCQVQRLNLGVEDDLIVRWIQQNWVLTLNHCINVNHRTKFSLKINYAIQLINGRLTFEPNSGDIADG